MIFAVKPSNNLKYQTESALIILLSREIIITAEKPLSWLDWFVSKESAQKIDELRKTAVFKTFSAPKTEEQIQDSLLMYNKIAFILKQNFGKNKLNIIHHISKIGGI